MDYYFAYIFKILLFLIVFSAIAFLAYTGTQFLGRKMSKRMRGKAMQMVESINLGLDKQLHLVRIGNRYYTVSASGKNLGEMKEVELDSATLEKMAEAENEDQELLGFETDFRTIWNKIKSAGKTGIIKKTVGIKNNVRIEKKDDSSSFGSYGTFGKNLDRLKKLTQDKMNQ